MEKLFEIPKYLTPRQVEAVLKGTTTLRDMAMLAVVYQCGLRRKEISYLCRRDWRPTESSDGILVVWRSKRKEGLVAEEQPVWPWVRKLLQEYLDSRCDDCEELFLSRKRGGLGGKGVYDVFRKVATARNLPEDLRHPHTFRHSIAVHLANMGAEAADVQAVLGHKSINSTMKYFRVTTPRKEDLVRRSGASANLARIGK
jgi:site-specific recombinase XerD